MRPRRFSARVFQASAVVAIVVVGAWVLIRVRKDRLSRELARVQAGELSRSDDTISEIDPHIAVSARGAIAVSFMGVSHVEGEGDASRAIGVRLSRDTGETWSDIHRVESPGDRYATDSMLAAAPDGAFVLTWLGFRASLKKGGAPYDLAVFASRAPASLVGFDVPTEITGGVRGKDAWMKFDKPWTAALADGSIVTSYRFEAPMRAGIRVARSKDTIHFEDSVVAEGPAFGGTLATICGTDPAHIFVAYVDASHGIWPHVVVHASDDGGATWSKRSEATRDDEHAVVEAPFCVAGGAHEDDLVVAYGIGIAPPDDSSSALMSAIEIVHSSDGGATWDARRMYEEPGAVMLHPALGRLASFDFELLYASGRGSGDPSGAIRRVRLAPDGSPRAPSEVVRSPIALATKRNPAAAWTGDFFGVATRGERAFDAFADNAGGASHAIYLAR